MKRDIRSHILTTASELFYARGINATGVDTIVAEAGIAKMTLYKYFRTKEDLVLEVLSLRSKEFCDWLSTRLAKAKANPAEKLNSLFDSIEEWLRDPEFKGLPFLKASAEFPHQDSAINQLSADLAREFREYLTTLVREIGAKSPESLGQQLAMLIEGAILSEQLDKQSGALGFAREAALALTKANINQRS
jgi:AcrR family transcriptional regulator